MHRAPESGAAASSLASEAEKLRDLILYLDQHVVILEGARLFGVQPHGDVKPVVFPVDEVFGQPLTKTEQPVGLSG